MWKQFCDSLFSEADRLQGNSGQLGYLSCLSQQPSAGFRDQAYADWILCACLLTDSCFHYYTYSDHRIWQELDIFSDPTTPFMLWHHNVFAPWSA